MEYIEPAFVALLLVVLAGALVQRLSGLGFALVAAPGLVLLAGPFEGILVANLLALPVSGTVLSLTWRHMQWSHARVLVPAGLAGAAAGALAARMLPVAPLQVGVGSLVLAGLLAVLASQRLRFEDTGPRVACAGVGSGFMAAAAGVGGPALTLYATATSWEHRAFAATAQLSFAAQAALSLGIKGLPSLAAVELALLLVATAAGLAVGQALARWVPAGWARCGALALALVGSGVVVAEAVLAW